MYITILWMLKPFDEGNRLIQLKGLYQLIRIFTMDNLTPKGQFYPFLYIKDRGMEEHSKTSLTAYMPFCRDSY